MGQLGVILVDTQVVLWLAFDLGRLSKDARKAIDDARKNRDGLGISDITLLEIATLASKGRIRLSSTLETFLQEVEARFTVLPISGRACARSQAFPPSYPEDAADREIRRSKLVKTIW